MWMDTWALNLPLPLWPVPPGADAARPSTHRVLFRFFETRRPLVVLSSSNRAEREAFPEICRARGVPVVKRKGGGGTVVLGPGCLVLTFAFYARDLFGNQKHFEAINGLWAEALARAGVPGACTMGISDLGVVHAGAHRKIAGTSIFRRKHLLVYQGSLLVEPDFETIETLLAHPSREPGYRGGRSHRDFLCSLRELGYEGTAETLAHLCTDYFTAHALDRFKDDFVDPDVLDKGGLSFWESEPQE